MKKILGVIFILAGTLLVLAFIQHIPKIANFVSVEFSGTANNWGYLFGIIFYYCIHFGLVYILFRFGLKWLKRTNRFSRSGTLDEDLLKIDSNATKE